MQKLTDEYWYKFKKNEKDGKVRRNGQLFEDLVADILARLYWQEQIKFERTQTTHDGSKDFVGLRDEGELIWAECKNYTDSISLTQVAPTLVMAEICNINEILFFSYSRIANVTMKKLSRYAQLRGKKLRLYDDDALENLILSLGSPILFKYFPTYSGKVHGNAVAEPYVFFALEKDPQFHPLTQEDEEARKDTVDQLSDISIGEILGISVSLVNRDATRPLTLELAFLPPSESPEDLYCFTFLDERIKPAAGNISMTFTVAPGSVYSETVYLRYSKRRRTVVYLPVTQLLVYDSGTQVYCREFSSPPVQTNWTRKAVFAGSGYEQIKGAFSANCVDCRHFGGLLLFGKSGTGKSRLLEECTGVLLSKRYHVLNFTGWENTSTSDIVKELLYILYNITGNMVLSVMADDAKNETLDDSRPDFRKMLTLLKAMHNGTVSENNLKPYYELIFEKLTQEGYTLIIDNLQNFDTVFLGFLKELVRYGMNRRRITKSLLLCSINLDETYDDQFYEFIADFNEWSQMANSRFYCSRTVGFQDEKQAISFLASILQLSVMQLDFPQMREMLNRCSLRPKYIEELADYLLQEGLVTLSGGHGNIPNPVRLIDALKQVPPKYDLLFRARYRSFVEHCALPKEQLGLFLSMVHLIKPLRQDEADYFNLPQAAAEALLKGGILERKDTYGHFLYRFEHDLMEQCFSAEPGFTNMAIEFLVQKRDLVYGILRQRHPAQYCMCRFRDEDFTRAEVTSLCQTLRGLSVPNNIEPAFYNALVTWLNKMNERELLSDEEYLCLAKEACVHIRDFICEEAAIPVFEQCHNRVKLMEINTPELLKLHFAFTIHYCENRNHLESEELFRENLRCYQEYLNMLDAATSLFPEKKRELEYACDYIKNRLFVCGKHLGCSEIFEPGMKQSIKSGLKNQFWDILFSDYFDYSSVLLYQDRNTALSFLERGLAVFEEHCYPEYELNYYKKKIQCAMLKGQLEGLSELFRAAFNCLTTSTAVKYHTYFRNCLLKLKVIWCLLTGAPLLQARQTLDDFNLSQYLLNKESHYEVLFLEAKVAQRSDEKEQWENAVGLYRAALSKCRQNVREKSSLRAICNCAVIEEELLPAVRALGPNWLDVEGPTLCGEICEDSWQVLRMSDSEYAEYRERHRSSALICGDGGREGFLL